MMSTSCKNRFCNICAVAIVFSICCISISEAIPSISASFLVTPVDTDGRARLICQAYQLGTEASYYVTIERTTASDRTEQLFMNTQVLPSVADNVRSSVSSGNDPKEYTLCLTEVYHRLDAGTYTCKIHDVSMNVVASSSAVLQINHLPAEYSPRCSLSGFNKSLSRLSGSEVKLGCQSDFGFPPIGRPVWSYNGCTDNRYLPDATVTDKGAYYSEITVTLSGEDNGGRFICTISLPDGSFSKSCTFGTFSVAGGTECDVTGVTTQSTVTSTTPSSATRLSVVARMVMCVSCFVTLCLHAFTIL